MHKTHGLSRTKEYRAWVRLNHRCHNPDYPGYHNYGARGIYVCTRWRTSFESFLADVGPAPSPAHSIERKDNDGPYSPGNCRWATRVEQGRNKRSNRLLRFEGRTQTLTDWASETGLNRKTLWTRLRRGWSLADALEARAA